MNPAIAEDRPPYVVFEMRAVEDRTESLAQGRYIAKDVAFAIITPAGSKDRIERNAEEWLKHIAQESRAGRFPADWANAYKHYFEEWKQGAEVPLNGIPLSDWPAISPAQHRMLTDLNIRTVEDLANATEEAILHMGMGARSLKDRAKAYLTSSVDVNKIAEENAALQVELKSQREKNEALEANIREINARLAALEPAPKRPTKPSDE